MAGVNRREEVASPWAFVAFEVEKPDAVWEAFEPEPVQVPHFAPFEQIVDEAPNALGPHDLSVREDEPLVGVPQATEPIGDHEADASHERQLRALEEVHQAALAELEHRYSVELISKLTSQIELKGAQIADEFGGRLSRLLAPVLFDHARKASLAALTRDLQRILASSEVNRIKLSGPREMMAQVQVELGEQASRFLIEETDTVDVTVRIDSEVLATRLSVWSAVLKDVVS
jgi:hypothetical protein